VGLREYAEYDIKAFIKRIRHIKMKELRQIHKDLSEAELNKRLKITYVGHSLGGMTLLMYLIN
jgi:hypothetical protein